MTERTKGMGEITAILALCAIILIGIIAVISHISTPAVAHAEAAPQASAADTTLR